MHPTDLHCWMPQGSVFPSQSSPPSSPPAASPNTLLTYDLVNRALSCVFQTFVFSSPISMVLQTFFLEMGYYFLWKSFYWYTVIEFDLLGKETISLNKHKAQESRIIELKGLSSLLLSLSLLLLLFPNEPSYKVNQKQCKYTHLDPEMNRVTSVTFNILRILLLKWTCVALSFMSLQFSV